MRPAVAPYSATLPSSTCSSDASAARPTGTQNQVRAGQPFADKIIRLSGQDQRHSLSRKRAERLPRRSRQIVRNIRRTHFTLGPRHTQHAAEPRADRTMRIADEVLHVEGHIGLQLQPSTVQSTARRADGSHLAGRCELPSTASALPPASPASASSRGCHRSAPAPADRRAQSHPAATPGRTSPTASASRPRAV